MPANHRSLVSAHAVLANLGLIIFLSFYPFNSWVNSGVPLFEFLSYPLPFYNRPFDNLVNTLIYLPYGFALAKMGQAGFTGYLRAVLLVALTSGLVETGQQFTLTRVASNLDVICNVAGGALGALLALHPWAGSLWFRLMRLRYRYLQEDSSSEYAALLMGVWFMTELNPAIPLFGLVVLPQGLPQPYISPLPDASLFLAMVEGGSAMLNLAGSLLFVTSFLSRRQYQLRAIMLILGLALLLKMLIAGVVLKPAEFFQWINLNVAVGLVLGLLLVWLVTRGQRLAQTVMALLCIVLSQVAVSYWPLSGMQADVMSLFRWQYGHLHNMSAMVDLLADLWPVAAVYCLLLSLYRQLRY